MHDTTSGRRIREINKVLRKTKVLSHPNPQKAVECLEQLANVTLHLKTLGCDRVMPEQLVKDLEALRPTWGIK